MINSKTPDIAVLLPSFNGAKFIEAQILSILKQKNISLTLYIYDDGSKDETCSKILKFESEKFKIISSLPDFPGKKSAAKSFFRIIAGIKLEPKYDYVAFADQDDIWFSDKIFRAIECLKNKKYSGYSSSITAFWQDGKTKFLKKNGNTSKFNSLFESAGPGCTYVINRKVFDLFKVFLIQNKEIFKNIDFHDWAIYSFVVNKGFKWFIDHKPGMFYRQHNNNSFGARSSFKQYIKRLELIMNGWYFSQVNIYHRLYFTNSIIIKYPKFIFLHRIYFFFMVLIHRRQYFDKIPIALCCLIAKLKIDD